MSMVLVHQRDAYTRAVMLTINKYLTWIEKHVSNASQRKLLGASKFTKFRMHHPSILFRIHPVILGPIIKS